MADTTNPTISQISISGTTYDIRDATARSDNETMEAYFTKYFNYMHNIKNSGNGVLRNDAFTVPPGWIKNNCWYLNVLSSNTGGNNCQVDLAFRSVYYHEDTDDYTYDMTRLHLHQVGTNWGTEGTQFGISYNKTTWGFYSENKSSVFTYYRLANYMFHFGDKNDPPTFEDVMECIDYGDLYLDGNDEYDSFKDLIGNEYDLQWEE